MPKPNKDESKDVFLKRCIPILVNEGKESEQASAICNSMYENQDKKEIRYAEKGILSYKETETDYVVKGYIATTHYDGQDKILKNTLDKWASEINEGIPRSNKASVHHDRLPNVTGVGVKGTAEVHPLSDGNYGLYVETLLDKFDKDFLATKYRIEKDILDSYSIEYVAPENPKYDKDGIRLLDENTVLHGWTLASRPMNEHAVMIKELVVKKYYDVKHEEKENKILQVDKEDKMTEQIVETKEQLMLSKEDMLLLKEAKEAKYKNELKEQFMSMFKDSEFQKEIMGLKSENKPVLQTKENVAEPESKTIKPSVVEMEYKEIFSGIKQLSNNEKFKRAAALAEEKQLIWKEGADKLGYKISSEIKSGIECKHFGVNGAKLEYKSLGITTNQNTDTDYLLSAAELRDVFDPVIYDVLNQSQLTWGLLQKDDFSNKGNNQVQFIIRNVANTTAAFYTGNSISLSQDGLLKVQTKFKKVQAGVSVDGDMIAASKGGQVSDVFGVHVKFATDALLHVINAALFAEVGLETAAAPIGFEYITDSAGNATLYNLTRSGIVGLVPTTATDTYINQASTRISLQNLRMAIKNATVEGGMLNNLVFITHPTQEVLFKGIYDASQQLMPTSLRVGFEGRPAFDGIPIFADKDCNSDDWWLVDLESHRIAIWVPPTLEMLGKRSDAEEGFIKSYLATYNTSPNRMVQIYGCATS